MSAAAKTTDKAPWGGRDRRPRAFAQAVFARTLKLRLGDVAGRRRRAGFDGDTVDLPPAYGGLTAGREERHHLAVFAHIAAHRAFTPGKFEVGRLKPVQVALVSLIEDARVEALAIRAFPGLAALWRPMHDAVPTEIANAAALMARLARALIDPSYADPNSWVEKGRHLFEAARIRLDDPAISREIGMLLGNDLGQMRVRFDAKAYVVEPPYRDDNQGLWNFPLPETPPDDADMSSEGVRLDREEGNDGKPESDDGGQPAPPEETVAVNQLAGDTADDIGGRVALYPEWDRLIERLRPDWVTLRESRPRQGDAHLLAAGMAADEAVSRQLRALVSGTAIGRPERLRRQTEGDVIDIDACIGAIAARRRRETPDQGLYIRSVTRQRDLAVLLLLDISQSTLDAMQGGGGSVLDAIRRSAALLGLTLDTLGDPVAVHAFQSNGRGDVRYHIVKAFAEPADEGFMSRLAGLDGGYSTRLGAAIRHAGRHLSEQRSFRSLLLVVTDGEPSDIDIHDRRYLTEDARQAVREIAGRGVGTYAIGLESGADQALERIFGRHGHVTLRHLRSLPDRLLQIYARMRR